MHVLPRLHLIAPVLGFCLLWPAVGRTQEESKKVCASAFADAQRLIRSGHLLAAKDKLVLCSGPECPTVMHPECQNLLSTVETSLSTVVFQVVASGPTIPDKDSFQDVRIAVDGGEPVPFDGHAIALDPGAHDFTFTANGFRPVVRQIVLGKGESLRREQVTLPPSLVIRPAEKPALLPATPLERVGRSALRKKSLTMPIVVSSSVAALASASAIYFGIQARRDDRALDACAPTATCSTHDVDRVQREYLWTNMSIGVAVAGLATTTILFFLNHRQPTKAKPAALGFAERRSRLRDPVPNDL